MVQSFNVPGIIGFLRALRYPKLLVPSCIANNIASIDFQAARNEARIKAICFDKDNCITLPYANEVAPVLKNAFDECKREFGADKMAVLSNSAGSSDDAPDFSAAGRLEKALGIPVIRHGSKKPDCGDAILRHFDGVKPSEILFVGDRLITDILMANRTGFKSVFVQSLSEQNDNIPAIFIRRLEIAWLKLQSHQFSDESLQKMIIRPLSNSNT